MKLIQQDIIKIAPSIVYLFSLISVCLFAFLFEKSAEPKKHRIFSKALLTDYAVVEELDFEVNFNKNFHALSKLGKSSDPKDLLELINSVSAGKGLNLNGTVASVIKSFRTDETESIFIIAPKMIKNGCNICGQAFLITIMKYLSKMNFFSRDIVFIFPYDHTEIDSFFQNLLKSSSTSQTFHNIPANVLTAINIEISGEACDSLNSLSFKYEGEASLPYMDLLNTLTKIADFHGLNIRFEGNSNHTLIPIPVFVKSTVRQFLGYLDSGHSYLLSSKIDSISIHAEGGKRTDDHDNIQDFYKFMVSAIRSLCNAIEHFQHESAVYLPTNEHNYYEFMDYLPFAIALIIPPVLLSLLDLYLFLNSFSAKIQLYELCGPVLKAYLGFGFSIFFFSQLLLKLSEVFPLGNTFSYLLILIEMLGLLTLKKYGPKFKASRMISGIFLFIGTLTMIFNSFGTGLSVYFISALVCFFISISIHSKTLEIILIPVLSFTFYLKILLNLWKMDSSINLIRLWGNIHMNLFIYPAILLLCCQESDFNLK